VANEVTRRRGCFPPIYPQDLGVIGPEGLRGSDFGPCLRLGRCRVSLPGVPFFEVTPGVRQRPPLIPEKAHAWHVLDGRSADLETG
jgi:hypothetical protein